MKSELGYLDWKVVSVTFQGSNFELNPHPYRKYNIENNKHDTEYSSWSEALQPIMKILFLWLFSRMSCFLIERDFKSCKEISLKFIWNFMSKRSILVKKPAGSKKFSNFKCNFLSSASLREAGFFSSESTWPGLSEMIRHIGVAGRAVLWERF